MDQLDESRDVFNQVIWHLKESRYSGRVQLICSSQGTDQVYAIAMSDERVDSRIEELERRLFATQLAFSEVDISDRRLIYKGLVQSNHVVQVVEEVSLGSDQLQLVSK